MRVATGLVRHQIGFTAGAGEPQTQLGRSDHQFEEARLRAFEQGRVAADGDRRLRLDLLGRQPFGGDVLQRPGDVRFGEQALQDLFTAQDHRPWRRAASLWIHSCSFGKKTRKLVDELVANTFDDRPEKVSACRAGGPVFTFRRMSPKHSDEPMAIGTVRSGEDLPAGRQVGVTVQFGQVPHLQGCSAKIRAHSHGVDLTSRRSLCVR